MVAAVPIIPITSSAVERQVDAMFAKAAGDAPPLISAPEEKQPASLRRALRWIAENEPEPDDNAGPDDLASLSSTRLVAHLFNLTPAAVAEMALAERAKSRQPNPLQLSAAHLDILCNGCDAIMMKGAWLWHHDGLPVAKLVKRLETAGLATVVSAGNRAKLTANSAGLAYLKNAGHPGRESTEEA